MLTLLDKDIQFLYYLGDMNFKNQSLHLELLKLLVYFTIFNKIMKIYILSKTTTIIKPINKKGIIKKKYIFTIFSNIEITNLLLF